MSFGDEAAPGSQAVIMPASWRDLNGLRYLEQVCFPKDSWPLLDLVGVLTLPQVIWLKATIGEKLVGFVAGDQKPHQHVSWIATIAVLPEYRGKGIGGDLLGACEERLETPRVKLCVRASNAEAIRLYEHRGYLRVDLWTKYYQDGEDALVMEKLL